MSLGAELGATGFKAPPIHGYQDVAGEVAAIVNENKLCEENILRLLDDLQNSPYVDKRWLAIGRNHIEQGWMAINRSLFKPKRVKLPEDANG